MLFIADVVISDQPFHLSLQVLPQIRQVHISIIYVSIIWNLPRAGGGGFCCPVYNQFWSQVCTDRQTAQCSEFLVQFCSFTVCLSAWDFLKFIMRLGFPEWKGCLISSAWWSKTQYFSPVVTNCCLLFLKDNTKKFQMFQCWSQTSWLTCQIFNC